MDAINDPTDVQSQPEETSEVPLIAQEGHETAQLPSAEFDNSPVQVETMDPSISKEVVQAEEFLVAVDSEEIVIEPPVQPSDVQGNRVSSRVFLSILSPFNNILLSLLHFSFPQPVV